VGKSFNAVIGPFRRKKRVHESTKGSRDNCRLRPGAMKTPDRRKAARLLRYQVFMLLPVTLGAGALGATAAWSALLGGALALVANAAFALVVFSAYEASEPGRLATRMYAAEVVKLASVALAFAAIFIWIRPLNVAALFVAFFVVQFVTPLLAHLVSARD
jgi:ATP synthase protein I